MPAIDAPDLQAGLRQSRHKLTRPRRAVLEVVAAAEQHLTPAEVYERAKAKYPKLGLTTVYRTLEILVRLGYVQRVHCEDGCRSYVTKARPHGHHLLCSYCGETREFTDCDLEPLAGSLQAKTGYEIEQHILQMIGRCPACQEQEQAPGPEGARPGKQSRRGKG